MDERASFIKFWDYETKTAHKVLARIPEGSTYRPDPAPKTIKEVANIYYRQSMDIVHRWKSLSASAGDGSLKFLRSRPTCGRWARRCRRSTD